MGARGPYRAGRATRAKIVEVAAQRFSTDGYHNTALADVARDVGVTTAGLLHHFPSKQHLLVAVAGHRLEASRHIWDGITDDSSAGEIVERMIDVTKHYLTEPELIELAVAVATEAADSSSLAHDVFAGRYATVVDTITGQFSRSAARGELFDGVDPAQLARTTVAISDGLQLQWTLADRGVDLLGLIATSLADLASATIRPEYIPPGLRAWSSAARGEELGAAAGATDPAPVLRDAAGGTD
ncbi:TetR/AcrR family transcriptional regulator [Actinotalea sp. M2MS4P-6]|uniref:TetR/AcrR family transcriptional regulator n=1 Tax=Actinotalea sp. M2MS4P-6 TaxID=2983762 RepID=UPI0021E3D012|nr:TetR/AcrR family transcriptional regulator [Actinotalea sp. M2MS4P-6]MCV2395890.1 TetR/AcrR family transcriptional regulator [Actinotalea sp. M2MS4P-6]